MPIRVFYLTLLMVIFLTGCVLGEANPTIDSSTAIAAAISTHLASLPTQTQTSSVTPEPATPTLTPYPSETPLVDTLTVFPTKANDFPYITWTPSTCDKSAFIADLDIIDYSKVYPGTSFTKTWRIKNIGTCTWTQEYRFTYISGTPMGADTTYLPKAVAPNETIDISLQMLAPEVEEDYSNFWRLRNTAGEIFGTTFYVAIEVSKDTSKPNPTEVQITAESTLSE